MTESPAVAAGFQLFGIPFEFFLFATTLLGVAVFHHRTLQVAVTGLAVIVLSVAAGVVAMLIGARHLRNLEV